MLKEVLIVLGAPNSPTGKLSKISKSRLDCCAKLFSPGKLVLCTGGWGRHFNISKEAHAIYAKRYLLKKGLTEDSFLDNALSENTVDDAVKVASIISGLGELSLTVITSDYHLDRVKIIFEEVLKGLKIEYIGTPSPLTDKELMPLIEHERKAIAAINKKGLYY